VPKKQKGLNFEGCKNNYEGGGYAIIVATLYSMMGASAGIIYSKKRVREIPGPTIT
jgi:hypothetical protein